MQINVAVMAGGQSRRFDGDKTVELFDGKPLIQHVVDALAGAVDDIVVVAKDCSKYSFLGAGCISDTYDVQCPMVGIITALRHFDAPVFAVSADAPFVNPAHVQKLYDMLANHLCVMPNIDGKLHPLYTVYHPDILPVLEAEVDAGQYSLMRAVKGTDVIYVENNSLFDSENEKKSFININTRDDFIIAKKYTGETDG